MKTYNICQDCYNGILFEEYRTPDVMAAVDKLFEQGTLTIHLQHTMNSTIPCECCGNSGFDDYRYKLTIEEVTK